MDILVLTPRDNRASRVCAGWGDELTERFTSLLSVRTERSRAATSALLDGSRHLLYFGHGAVDALVVPGRLLRPPERLVDRANIAGPPERIVIAVACWSGTGLAREACSLSGGHVAAYLGWGDEMGWPPQWSEPIGHAVVEGIATLLNGATVNECAAAIRHEMDGAYETYLGEPRAQSDPDTARFGRQYAVFWKSLLVVEGNGSATVV